jgi:hypothetical protein
LAAGAFCGSRESFAGSVLSGLSSVEMRLDTFNLHDLGSLKRWATPLALTILEVLNYDFCNVGVKALYLY